MKVFSKNNFWTTKKRFATFFSFCYYSPFSDLDLKRLNITLAKTPDYALALKHKHTLQNTLQSDKKKRCSCLQDA